jgi:hypothetical protein
MNKSLLKGISASILVIAAMASCKKNNLVIDKEVVPPSAVKFNVLKPADTLATYYIKSSGEAFKIPIGITTVSDKDRTIQFSMSSRTAVAGTHYNAPASIVIPAGKALDSLSIQGLFAGYPLSTRIDTLTIKITGGDVPVNAYWNTYKLILRKYCDVNLTSFAGAYNNAIDNGNYGPYPMTITPGTATGTTGRITVANLWDPGVPVTTTVNLDWTNPAAFTATIPDQVFFGPADLWIVGTTAGTFSSCDQTFTLRYKLYYKTSGATYYNNQVTVIRR